MLFQVHSGSPGRPRQTALDLKARARCCSSSPWPWRGLRSGYFSGYGAIASELFPTAIRATAMGLSYNIGRGLSALAPFAVGALAIHYGLGRAFFLPAAAFFVAALLALALPETKGKQLD